jgi:hypothetical protein
MDSAKAWKWFAIILVILNIALCISVFLQLRPKASFSEKPPHDFIIQSLNLSQDQIKQFEILRKSHHDSILVLQEVGKELRHAYFDKLKGNTFTPNLADSLLQEIGNNQKLIEQITFQHFAQVKALCNEEQKKVFDKAIDEIIIRVMGRPNNRGPHAYAPTEESEGRPLRPPPPEEKPLPPPYGGPEGSPPPLQHDAVPNKN